MFDWSSINDKVIAEKVFQESYRFMKLCHYGIQGIHPTEEDVISTAQTLINSGYHAMAFDVEMNYVHLVKDMLKGIAPIHCAVSYPTGRMPLAHKLHDMAKLYELGVEDVCVCLDWQALFSKRYKDIEKEAEAIQREFGGVFKKLAPVIPATLMSDTEIIAVCNVLDSAGTVSIKVNPGTKLHVSFEEIRLIKRHFLNRFDVHPSGGIRTLYDAEKYLELGCNVIHSASCLEITDELIKRQVKRYTGAVEI